MEVRVMCPQGLPLGHLGIIIREPTAYVGMNVVSIS